MFLQNVQLLLSVKLFRSPIIFIGRMMHFGTTQHIQVNRIGEIGGGEQPFISI